MFSPIYRRGNWGGKILSNSAQATYQASAQPGMGTEAVLSQAYYCVMWPFLLETAARQSLPPTARVTVRVTYTPQQAYHALCTLLVFLFASYVFALVSQLSCKFLAGKAAMTFPSCPYFQQSAVYKTFNTCFLADWFKSLAISIIKRFFSTSKFKKEKTDIFKHHAHGILQREKLGIILPLLQPYGTWRHRLWLGKITFTPEG